MGEAFRPKLSLVMVGADILRMDGPVGLHVSTTQRCIDVSVRPIGERARWHDGGMSFRSGKDVPCTEALLASLSLVTSSNEIAGATCD